MLKRFKGREFLIFSTVFLVLSVSVDYYVNNFDTDKIQDIRFWIFYLFKVIFFGLIMSFSDFNNTSNRQNEKY